MIATGDTLLAKKVMLSGLGEGEAPPPQMAAALQAAALNEVDEQLLTAPGAGAAKGLSLDGALMSLWGDGKARVWQAQIRQARTGKPLVLEIPGRSITAAALSPDGRHAATASVASGNTADADAVAHVEFWSLSGATAGTTVQFRSYAVGDLLADIRSIKYHPGGKRVILASGSGPALLIATANGDLQRVIGDETGATTAVFSPKGDAILVADTQGGVGLFGADGAPVPNFRAVQVDKGVVTTARFTESGARFVVGTDKGKLSVYSAVSGEKLMTLPGHSKAVTGVAFSPDSSMIVSASKDGTLRLWEHGITAGHLLRTLRTTRPDAATSAVNAVAFGTDGDTIVAARENGTISMLDLAGKKLIRKTPAGREQLIPRTPGGQGIWRALSTRAQVIATLEPLEDPVDVFGDVFFAVAAWHAGSDRPVARIKVRNPYDIMFSDDGTRLAVLDEVGDGVAISIVATEGGALMTRQPIFIPAPPDDTSAGKNGKDIPVWTSLSADGTVMIIVMKSSRLVAWRGGDSLVDIPVPRDHPLAVNNAGLLYVDLPIAFSVGGPMRFAMSSQGQPMVAIHDGTTGKLSAQVKSAGNVETMLFAPDGRTIFVGNDDGSGAIFDTATGRVRVRLDGRHDNAIGYAAFNADGTMLVTASIDGAARLWLTSDGSLLHALVDEGNSIADAEFSHDGKRLITGAENRIATLWDVATGKPLTVLPGPLKSGAITGWFSRDDKRAITLSDDTTLRTWNIDTPVASYDSLFRNVCNNGGLATDDRSDAGIDSAARQVCRDRAQPANGTWRDRMMKRLGLRR